MLGNPLNLECENRMRFLAQQDFAVPPEISAALSDKFLSSIGVPKPVPIVFLTIKKEADAGGWCDESKWTEADEIVIDRETVSPTKIPEIKTRWVVSTYIHELCHRVLPPDEMHNLRFFALNLLMHRRASAKKDDAYFWQSVSFYDGQDVGFHKIGHATNLAIEFCERYQNTNLTITQLTEIAKKELSSSALSYQVNLKVNHEKQIAAFKKNCDDKIFKARVLCLVGSFVLVLIGKLLNIF